MSSSDRLDPNQLSLPGVEEHLKKHPLQPWQMSRAQYEADPQTLWRAEQSDTLGGAQPHPASGGLHFGDYAAAKFRGEKLQEQREDRNAKPENAYRYPEGYDAPVRLFSVRAHGKFSNEPVPEHPASDVLPQTRGTKADEDRGGGDWPRRRTGRWYLNEIEGVHGRGAERGPANVPALEGGRYPGTLSGYVPRRQGFLTTHREEVLKAHAEGKDVHPSILQAAQMFPEYSETIDPMVDYEPEPKMFKEAYIINRVRHFTPEEYDAIYNTDLSMSRLALGDPVPAGKHRKSTSFDARTTSRQS